MSMPLKSRPDASSCSLRLRERERSSGLGVAPGASMPELADADGDGGVDAFGAVDDAGRPVLIVGRRGYRPR